MKNKEKSYMALTEHEQASLLIGKKVRYIGSDGVEEAYLVAVNGKDMFFTEYLNNINYQGFWIKNAKLFISDFDFSENPVRELTPIERWGKNGAFDDKPKPKK